MKDVRYVKLYNLKRLQVAQNVLERLLGPPAPPSCVTSFIGYRFEQSISYKTVCADRVQSEVNRRHSSVGLSYLAYLPNS